ncbi:hypothetical protein ANO14919_094330 [Xylariales sp. No.14919]|nr:hypothetical protein ANO14919_094330 [Xylariales sp. No.14919]
MPKMWIIECASSIVMVFGLSTEGRVVDLIMKPSVDLWQKYPLIIQ